MKHLYFIRHGESEFNKANKWAGSSDTPLTNRGHAQAKETGAELKKNGVAFDIVISSPLERAHDTAKHVASAVGYPHEEIRLHDQLVERNFGKLEGRKDLAATTKYVLSESAIDSYEGVESLKALHERAEEVLNYLHGLDHDTILIVGHGAFGRALRRVINNEPMHPRGKRYANAEIAKLI